MVYYFVINVVFLVCLTTVVFVDILLINYFDSKGRKCPSEQRGERSYSSPTIAASSSFIHSLRASSGLLGQR